MTPSVYPLHNFCGAYDPLPLLHHLDGQLPKHLKIRTFFYRFLCQNPTLIIKAFHLPTSPFKALTHTCLQLKMLYSKLLVFALASYAIGAPISEQHLALSSPLSLTSTDEQASSHAERDVAADYKRDGVTADYKRDEVAADYKRDDVKADYKRGEVTADYKKRDDMEADYKRGEVAADYKRDDVKADYKRNDVPEYYKPQDMKAACTS